MPQTIASIASEVTNEKVRPKDEKLLSDAAKLFEPPETTESQYSEVIKTATHEIFETLENPVVQLKKNVESKSGVLGSMYEKKLHETTQALIFFNDFCDNLNKSAQVVLGVEEESAGGIRMKLENTSEKNGNWGKLLNEEVKRVEIVIKTGRNTANAKTSYTPMQLNFRFINPKDEEVSSLRLDLHNREFSKGIELDAVIGDDKDPTTALAHKNIKSLSDGNYVSNFKALQAQFLVNFCEKHFFREAENEKVDVRERVLLTDATLKPVSRIAREYKEAQKYLEGEADSRF